MAEWQPIKTAPKGKFTSFTFGPHILLGSLDSAGLWECCVGCYSVEDIESVNGMGWNHDLDNEPTHWMPLPEPPK